MGDRANIHILEDDKDIYFYTHWDGEELPQILARSLEKGRNRWHDPSYLNRIIFCEMVKGDVSGETGCGIGVHRDDFNYDDIVLNHSDMSVTDRDGQVYSFDEFIKAKMRIC